MIFSIASSDAIELFSNLHDERTLAKVAQILANRVQNAVASALPEKNF
jgi:hypothetical protein